MSVALRGGGQLRQISRDLRRAGDGQVTRAFRRELRAAAAPLVPVVRQAALGIPVKGTAGPAGLRRRLAKATRLRVKTVGKGASVQILVDPRRMPSGEKALPQYMEGLPGHSRWRHPVFGHDVWVQQDSHPFFFPALRPLGLRSRVAVNRVIGSITADITGRGLGTLPAAAPVSGVRAEAAGVARVRQVVSGDEAALRGELAALRSQIASGGTGAATLARARALQHQIGVLTQGRVWSAAGFK